MLRACRHVGQRTRTRALDARRPSARTGGVFCSTGGLIASSYEYVRDSLRPDSVDCSAHAGWVGISEMASASPTPFLEAIASRATTDMPRSRSNAKMRRPSPAPPEHPAGAARHVWKMRLSSKSLVLVSFVSFVSVTSGRCASRASHGTGVPRQGGVPSRPHLMREAIIDHQ